MPEEHQELEIETPEETILCDRCDGESSAEEDTYSVQFGRNTQTWCNRCFDNYAFCCSDCEEVYSNSHSCSDADGNSVCEECAESYFTCDDCGNRFHNDDYAEDERCVNCHSEESAISDYSADVCTVPVGQGPHFFGVELEVESVSGDISDQARCVRDQLGDSFAIVKRDGSLSNGFEIVTRPASLAIQLEKWPSLFANVPKGLRSFNTTTCGLHVHCSREPLTELTIAKIVCFTNAAHNRRFMSTIAGRESANWAAYHAKKLGEANKRNPSRYEAVNLQNNETIEFRIFKGTLRQASVFKAIEFCDALIAFCSPASRSLRDAFSRVSFIEYVQGNAKRWPHLSAFIDAKWYGKITPATIKLGFKPAGNNEEQNQMEEQ